MTRGRIVDVEESFDMVERSEIFACLHISRKISFCRVIGDAIEFFVWCFVSLGIIELVIKEGKIDIEVITKVIYCIFVEIV